MYPLNFPENQLQLLRSIEHYDVPPVNVPLLAFASFSAGNDADTFLKLDGWSKVRLLLRHYVAIVSSSPLLGKLKCKAILRSYSRK